MSKTLELLLPPFLGIAGSLGASYAGARHAFKLERKRRQEEAIGEQVSALNEALVSITWCRNRIYNLRSQVVEPVRDHPYRHLSASARSPQDMPPQISLDRVSMLPRSHELINAYFQAYSATRYAANAFQFANTYSDYHLTAFQPLVGKITVERSNSKFDAQSLAAALPVQVERTLARYFDELVQSTDDAREKLREAEELLFRAAKKVFPKELFFIAAVPDDPQPDYVRNAANATTAKADTPCA